MQALAVMRGSAFFASLPKRLFCFRLNVNDYSNRYSLAWL